LPHAMNACNHDNRAITAKSRPTPVKDRLTPRSAVCASVIETPYPAGA